MAAKWFIEKNGKFYGPFEAAKVLTYHQTGKISDATAVADNREGSGAKPFTDVAEALRNGPSEPEVVPAVKKPQPMPRPQKPAPRKRAVRPEGLSAINKTSRKHRRYFIAIMLFVLVGMTGGAFYLLISLQDNKTFEKVRLSILEESAPLRSQAHKTEVPNFNSMVIPALQKLFLPYHQIAQSHRQAVLAYDSENGAKHFARLYAGTVRRETQFLTNGQIAYTYVFDETMACVAVAIHGPNFARLHKDQVAHADFSKTPVRETAIGERIVWLTQMTPEVRAEAHWKLDGASYVLDYVAIIPNTATGE